MLRHRISHTPLCVEMGAPRHFGAVMHTPKQAQTHLPTCVRSLRHDLQVISPRGRLRCPGRRSWFRAYHPASFPGCKLQSARRSPGKSLPGIQPGKLFPGLRSVACPGSVVWVGPRRPSGWTRMVDLRTLLGPQYLDTLVSPPLLLLSHALCRQFQGNSP